MSDSYILILVCYCPCVFLDTNFKNNMVVRLMQYDASSHTALTILDTLQAHRINVQISDLNSIEHI